MKNVQCSNCIFFTFRLRICFSNWILSPLFYYLQNLIFEILAKKLVIVDFCSLPELLLFSWNKANYTLPKNSAIYQRTLQQRRLSRKNRFIVYYRIIISYIFSTVAVMFVYPIFPYFIIKTNKSFTYLEWFQRKKTLFSLLLLIAYLLWHCIYYMSIVMIINDDTFTIFDIQIHIFKREYKKRSIIKKLALEIA